MGKSAAANWAGRWARGGKPDPLIGVPDRANDSRRKMHEFEDPTSRYQNPRYSGKKIPKEKGK